MNNVIYLTRIKHGAESTLGIINTMNRAGIFNIPLYSLELAWKNNERNISCIPAGRYPYTVEFHSKFKMNIVRVHDVPGRSGILIHPANFVTELKGCIAPGLAMSATTPEWAVSRSRLALLSLVSTVQEKGFLYVYDFLNIN